MFNICFLSVCSFSHMPVGRLEGWQGWAVNRLLVTTLVQTDIGFSMEFGTDIHVPLGINCNTFGDHLSFS